MKDLNKIVKELQSLNEKVNMLLSKESSEKEREEKSMGGNIAAGAAQGAMSGAAIAPPFGAIAGAVAGGTVGYFKGKAEKEANNVAKEEALQNKIAQMNAEEGQGNVSTNDLENMQNKANASERTAMNADMLFQLAQLGASYYNPSKTTKAEGGALEPEEVTSFKGERHENGGTPLQNSNVEVEKGETAYNEFVFSDRIKIPGKNITFAKESERIKKQYGQRKEDKYDKEAMEIELSRLATLQEMIKEYSPKYQKYHKGVQMAEGGTLKATPEMSVDIIKESINRGISSEDFLKEIFEDKLKMEIGGELAEYYAMGGKIRIKPSKRGTFTAAATKHNMGVQEFANYVLSHKDKFSPLMVKKAVFAKNAKKWHKALGGPVDGDVDNNDKNDDNTQTQQPQQPQQPNPSTPQPMSYDLPENLTLEDILNKVVSLDPTLKGKKLQIKDNKLLANGQDYIADVNDPQSLLSELKKIGGEKINKYNVPTLFKIATKVPQQNNSSTEFTPEYIPEDLYKQTYQLNEYSTEVYPSLENIPYTNLTTDDGKTLRVLPTPIKEKIHQADQERKAMREQIAKAYGFNSPADIPEDFYIEPQDFVEKMGKEFADKYYNTVGFLNTAHDTVFSNSRRTFGDIEGKLPLREQKLGKRHLKYYPMGDLYKADYDIEKAKEYEKKVTELLQQRMQEQEQAQQQTVPQEKTQFQHGGNLFTNDTPESTVQSVVEEANIPTTQKHPFIQQLEEAAQRLNSADYANYTTAPDISTSEETVSQTTGQPVISEDNSNPTTAGGPEVGTNWKDALGQNIGNLYMIGTALQGAETVTPNKITPELVDAKDQMDAVRRTFDESGLINRENIRRNATTSGQALANLNATTTDLATKESSILQGIQAQVDAQNAQIRNNAQMFNTQVETAAQQMTAQNKAAQFNNLSAALSTIGKNLMQQKLDNKKALRDEEVLSLLRSGNVKLKIDPKTGKRIVIWINPNTGEEQVISGQ
jgi:hypothetical protein